jgi:D-amino-acid oxidase
MTKPTVTIIGAGVMGLTTGIKLLKAGYHVIQIAENFSPQTTSDAASASFHPYIKPDPLLFSCILESWDEYRTLKKEIPSIIKEKNFRELHSDPSSFEAYGPVTKSFLENLEGFKVLKKEELPMGYELGFTYKTLAIDTALFIPYLNKKFLELGGIQKKKKILSLDELIDTDGLVINCTGVGAKDLVKDADLVPVRGQAHLLAKTPEIQEITLAIIKAGDSSHPDHAIIVPRANDIYVAGTSQINDMQSAPREKDQEKIINRCASLFPIIKNLKVLGSRVGFRPEILLSNGSRTIRLYHEHYRNRLHVIHNYGHAGAGISASLGSANKVLALVDSLI